MTRTFLIAVIAVLLAACDDMLEKDYKYVFVGDSIINYWPLDETFPSQVVYNYGKSGAGIDYVADFRNSFYGKDVVVIIGTNDYAAFYSENPEDYVRQYIEAVSELTDKTVYLFSVLPRQYASDPADINSKIEIFNRLVRTGVQTRPDIVYIDVYDDFIIDGHINYQLYSDGLHLTVYGYELLSSKLLDHIG